MEIDESLCHLGKYSKWHILNFFALALVFKVPHSFHFTSIVFIGYKPPYQCKPASTFTNQSQPNETFTCEMHLHESEQLVPCENGWEFPNFTGSTIVTEWQLVCYKEAMSANSQIILVAGFIMGICVLSFLADKFGRRTICLYGLSVLAVVSTLSSFSPNFTVFAISRFLIGLLCGGILNTGHVLIHEIFPTRRRTFGGIFIDIFWSTSIFSISILCYFVENWRYQQLSIGIYCFLVLPLFCLIRESVLWDVSKGRIEHAEATLRIAARMNGVTFDEPILKTFELKFIETTCEKSENTSEISKKVTEKISKNDSVLDLFTNRVMLFYLVSSSLLWFGIIMVYFSLLLSSATMHGNRFINTALGSIGEVITPFIIIFISPSFGRKKLFQTFLISSAIFSFISSFCEVKRNDFPEITYYAVIVATTSCKVFLNACFSIAFLYVSELFPTTIRSTASGIASMIGRMATFLSVYSVHYMEKVPWICYLVYGFISLFLVILFIFLPETHNKKLPSTVQEACNMKEKHSKKLIFCRKREFTRINIQ